MTELEEIRKGLNHYTSEATKFMSENDIEINARFPRGYIRPISHLLRRWPYLEPDSQRTLACMIQLCDINRWNLNMWDIGLTAGTVWEWHCFLPIVFVMETLLKEFGLKFEIVSKRDRFAKVITSFNENGFISDDLRKNLDYCREFRNKAHLFLIEKKIGLHDGKPERYNLAVKTLEELETVLLEHWLNKRQ